MTRGIILTCSLLLASSCAAMHDRAPDTAETRAGLLAFVPEEGRVEIQEARAYRAQVNEDLRIAGSDLQQVQSRREIAQHDLQVIEQRVEEARDRVEHARRFGSQEDLEQARMQLEETNDARRFAEAKIRYYEDLEGLADDLVRLHENRVALAEAIVEREEALAISQLDRPAAREIDVQAYHGRVAELQDRVAMNDIEARASRMRVELRREYLYDRVGAVPAAFRLSEPEPVESLLTLPRGDNGPWGMPRGDSGGMQQQQQQRPQQQQQPGDFDEDN